MNSNISTFLNGLRVLGLFCLSLLTLSCGGGNNSQSPSSTAVIVQPNVRVLPSDGSVTISNVTPTSVTLSGKVPALSPGIVLVSGQGEGMLRKVVSVASSGNSQVVQTVTATLPEVFKQADIKITKTFGPDDYTQYLCTFRKMR